MKFLLNPVSSKYRNWMLRWENQLCFRATDRIARPFEYGVEWSRNWPFAQECMENAESEEDFILRINRSAIEGPEEFFGYEPPSEFSLEDNWLSFQSPVATPYEENNTVRGLWFPANKPNGKAVVVLPHWNSKLPQQNALCAGLQRLGISALRLSLPYHDSRMPAGLTRADYAVSSNICRTIDATRQAVIDTRSCFDWLAQEGFNRLGIVGTSLGSCYAFLASAHDPRIRVNIFNHCSTYFADVVWTGQSTRHVRAGIEPALDRDRLRHAWDAISPMNYFDRFTEQMKKILIIY